MTSQLEEENKKLKRMLWWLRDHHSWYEVPIKTENSESLEIMNDLERFYEESS